MAFGLSAGAISLIGTGVGAVSGLMGSGSGGGGGGPQQTQSKDPWAEAAPWLKRQIERGQVLQNQYEQNPFNAQQQTAYQNTFGDLNNFRSNIAPGLMQFANNAMAGGYQRQQLDRPGQGGYGQRQPMRQNAAPQPGPFSTAQPGLMGASSQYAPVDFAAQNAMPRMAPQQAAPAPAPAVETEYEATRKLEEYQRRTQSDYFGRN